VRRDLDDIRKIRKSSSTEKVADLSGGIMARVKEAIESAPDLAP
jgi:hypothetical protein